MMRFIAVTLFAFLITLSSASADYEAGKAAYDAGDYETAYNEWLPLAGAQNAKASFAIGLMFDNGTGVEPNPDKAIKYYQIASENGYHPAFLSLGISLLLRPTSSEEELIDGIVAIIKAISMKVEKAEQALEMVRETVPPSYMDKADVIFKTNPG